MRKKTLRPPKKSGAGRQLRRSHTLAAQLQDAAGGNALPALARALFRDRPDVVAALVELHNTRIVDVVSAYSRSADLFQEGAEFFMQRHVFEKVLPDLDAPVEQVVPCVSKLFRAGGEDMAAGMIVDSFREYCAREATRPQLALEEIEKHPEESAVLLTEVLVMGAKSQPAYFLEAALRLTGHVVPLVRRMAALALGQMPESTTGPEAKRPGVSKGSSRRRSRAASCVLPLTDAVNRLRIMAENEPDDGVLSSVVIATLRLWVKDEQYRDSYLGTLQTSIVRGGSTSLYAAAREFGFNTKALPGEARDVLLAAFREVNPAHTRILQAIDYGLKHLLEQGNTKQPLALLEELLRKGVPPAAFDDAARYIRVEQPLMRTVLTRWFLTAELPLCKAVVGIVGAKEGDELHLGIDEKELRGRGGSARLFVARKAVGFLFNRPIAASSVVIDAIKKSRSATERKQLTLLLADALLRNYGGIRAYVAQESARARGVAKECIEEATKLNDTYLEGLRSVGRRPDLRPSTRQRAEYQRRLSEMMAEAYSKAHAESPLLGLVTMQMLMHGTRSIDYRYPETGEVVRTETPLGRITHEVERPRGEVAEAVALDLMLRRFKVERLAK